MKQLVTCISAANTLRCGSLSGLDLDQPSAFTEDTLWACVHVLYKTGGKGVCGIEFIIIIWVSYHKLLT